MRNEVLRPGCCGSVVEVSCVVLGTRLLWQQCVTCLNQLPHSRTRMVMFTPWVHRVTGSNEDYMGLSLGLGFLSR